MTVEYVGPFKYHAVVVDGWRVPYLTATPRNDGNVHISLDDRYCLWDLTTDEAERIVPFLADAIAIAAGFTCHPRPDWEAPVPKTPYRKMFGVVGLGQRP